MAMRDDTITPFARLLLHHRIAAGLTQEKLAEKTADNAHVQVVLVHRQSQLLSEDYGKRRARKR